MKTTVEIPDRLFHRAKLASAHRRVTLKRLIIEGLEKSLAEPAPAPPLELTREQETKFALDEFGVPVLKARHFPPDNFLPRIQKLREELGV